MAMASTSQLLPPIIANPNSEINRHSFSKQEIAGFHCFSPKFPAARRYFLITKATASTPSDQNPKRKSVICADCDGNGAVLCSQCKGNGVNSVDFFGGQFKAGQSCWLCGGKKDMLCGNCNGAGFVGGFLSTQDE